MAIVGNLIKGVIDLTGNINLNEKTPLQHQKEVLQRLLTTASGTAFGKYYGFHHILSQSDIPQAYKSDVPIHTYQRMNADWWTQQQKFPDITWPGKPDFFALSSGTTGKKSKRIPVTPEMIGNTKAVGRQLLRDLINFDLPSHVFDSEVLMLGSSTNLRQNINGFLEGEISGINTYSFPDWYDWFYRPGKEISAIEDWDERIEKIVEEAPKWNIGSIAGIPSWILLMLKTIVKKYNLQTIHDIWPNLEVYNTGGVAFGPFKQDFDKITARPLTIIDTYLASEGFFGYTSRPDTLDMKLVVDTNVYYEFVPFDERGFDSTGELLDNPQAHHIGEVENGVEYALLITTCSGAWRYMIGDTIKFTDVENLQFRISGRTKFFLNVVGSQLSEEKLNTAIEELANQTNSAISEFSVAGLQDDDGEYYHQWIIACDSQLYEQKCVDILDAHLKSANKNYRVARSKALKYIQVKCITTLEWYKMIDAMGKKGGQVKTPKVVNAEKMKTLLSLLTK